MGYIYGLLITALFFTAMHYFTELDKKQKLIISAVLLAVIMAAVAYNKTMQQEQEKLLKLVTLYEQGKTLTCNNKDVNSTNYTLSVGTYTLIGKENTSNYAEMIPLATCKPKSK